jgi:DNA replication licensing factor MCM2
VFFVALRQEEDFDQEANENAINLEAFGGPLRDWIGQDRTRREIKKKFEQFLTTFTREGRNVHGERIRDMCARNQASLEVVEGGGGD